MLSTFRFSPNRLSLCARSTIVAASSDLQRRAAGGNAVNKYAGFRIPSSVDLVKAAPASLRPYLQIMRVDKPIGSWLLFWPCTWSIALATPPGQLPSLYYFTLFGAGAFLMRSAGCVINDLWDKDFDRKVERTKMRPLACGSMSQIEAVCLLTGLLTTSLGILLQLNWFSIAIGASSMLLVIGYPLAKRYTYWPQFVLGSTLNWGVLIAWAEMLPMDQFQSVIPLYLSTVLYTVIYDTIYSHQDKADDVIIGVKSTALKFGENTKYWLSGFGATTVVGLAIAGHLAGQTWPYYAALAGTTVQLAWQIGTVNIHDGSDCWNKFKSNQWMGAILLSGIIAGNLLRVEKNEKSEENRQNT